MVLFIGGVADGLRIEVDTKVNNVIIPVEPTPPGYTNDMVSERLPSAKYKKECISCGLDSYCVFIPEDWTCNDLVEALILNYRDSLQDCLNTTAKGNVYETRV